MDFVNLLFCWRFLSFCNFEQILPRRVRETMRLIDSDWIVMNNCWFRIMLVGELVVLVSAKYVDYWFAVSSVLYRNLR